MERQVLEAKGWRRIATGEGHPLGLLAGARLGRTRLDALEGPANPFGARYFALFSRRGHELLLLGLYHRGEYPAQNWVEMIAVSPRIAGSRRELSLFRHLGALVPPGGHLMVEYESPERGETARALGLGVPPSATPLGGLLFRAGCGVAFKDHYYAEGWREGARKLQGFKALNPEHARERAGGMAQALRDFLARKASSEIERKAQRRARRMLKLIAGKGVTEDEGAHRIL